MIYVLGSGVPFAVIGVTCPVGATCTCSNGSKTYTKKNATGKVLFQVPQAGTWTVTITDGSSSKSETVKITTKGQVETVELAYELLLFSPNNEHTDITGGWQKSGTDGSASIGSTMSLSIEGLNNTVWRSVYTLNAIDLSKYSILRAQVASCTLSDATSYAFMYAGDAYVDIGGKGQVELDVSGINSAVTISFKVYSYSGTAELEISKVTLL